MDQVPFCVANEWWKHPELLRQVIWKSGNGVGQIIAQAFVRDEEWQIRMNDFPEEPLHTLVISGNEVFHFDDWPEHWHKPALPSKVDWSKRPERQEDH